MSPSTTATRPLPPHERGLPASARAKAPSSQTLEALGRLPEAGRGPPSLRDAARPDAGAARALPRLACHRLDKDARPSALLPDRAARARAPRVLATPAIQSSPVPHGAAGYMFWRNLREGPSSEPPSRTTNCRERRPDVGRLRRFMSIRRGRRPAARSGETRRMEARRMRRS